MAYPTVQILMGGRIITYQNYWVWRCPYCAQHISFLMELHPDQDKALTVRSTLYDHMATCQSPYYAQHNAAQHQNFHLQQAMLQQNLAAQQMTAFGQQLANGGLGLGQGGGLHGNWPTNSSTHSSAIAGAVSGSGGTAQATTFYSECPSQPPAKPLERAGTKFGEIIGWRMWSLRGDYLASYSQDIIWAPGEPMSGKPGDYDQAGIWAFKDKHRAIKKMLEDSYQGDRATIFGSVLLWGDIVEHEGGYRAQYASVRTIDDCYNGDGKKAARKTIIDDLRQLYNLKEAK